MAEGHVELCIGIYTFLHLCTPKRSNVMIVEFRKGTQPHHLIYGFESHIVDSCVTLKLKRLRNMLPN